MNKSKIKGTGWENDAVEELEKLIDGSIWKRVIGSGAYGTAMGEPLLMSDLVGAIPGYPKKFRVECKVGYSNSKEGETKSFNLQKLWLDKLKEEALGSYSFPFLIGKFSNVRNGVKHFVVMDVRDFAELMNHMTDLKEDLDKLLT